MKWYWKILIALMVLLTIGFFSIDYVATRIVEKEIFKLKSQLQGNYDIVYESLELSLVNKTVVLRKFGFSTMVDSTYLNNKYELKLEKLYLKYATYADIFFKRSIDIFEIVLKEPEIRLGIRSHKKKVIREADVVEEADSLKTSFFEKITLTKFSIESGKVDVYNLEKPDFKIVFVNDLDANIKGLVIDLLKDSFYMSAEYAEKPLFSFKDVYKNDLKKHTLKIDEILYHFDTKELFITNFFFENKESPEVFRKSLSHRSPWFSIKVPHINLKIYPRKVYESGILYLPKLEIVDADVTISNDLNFPIKPGNKPMPGSQIKSTDFSFLIDSLIISNSELKYIHKSEAVDPGLFKLSKINALALSVTDIDSLIAFDPFLDLSVRASLWDEGNLNVNFRFDLSSATDRIDVAGSLKNMAVKKAENMIKPLYGIDVESGHIDLLDFNFVMDENMGKGKLKFDYKDLKVDFKAKEKEENDEQEKNEKKEEHQYTDKSMGLLNFAVGEAIRDNNQPGDKNYVAEGNIIVDRTKIKPVFDLLWNSIANGLMDVVIKDAFYDSQKNYEKKAGKQEKKDKQPEKKGLFNRKNKD